VRKFSSNPPKEEDAPPPDDDDFPRRDRGPKKLPVNVGLNRFVWDLAGTEPKRMKNLILWGGLPPGAPTAPGTYQVRLSAYGKSETLPLEIRRDPRLGVTDDDLRKQNELLAKINAKLTEAHDGMARLRAAREQVTSATERAKGLPQEKEIADAGDALKKKLTAVEEKLYQTKNQSNQDPLNFPIRLNNKLSWLANVVSSAETAPTDQSVALYTELAGQIDAELATLKKVIEEDVKAFNETVAKAAVPAVKMN
jgi:hypothetical protein